VTWCWIITLQWGTSDSGIRTKTVSGRLTSDQAASLRTRRAAYPAILAAAVQSAGVPDGVSPVTLFFSLEPDDLTAAGRAA
jgi:hypothetical protein